MGRAPCCDKANVKKGPWSPEEDTKLKEFIEKYGTGGNWIALPHKVGLKRCGKSCRLRWLNYLRPNIKHGEFSADEDRIICTLFASIGSRWSIIASQLPGRTDNDIKNYWNTKLKKKLLGISPSQRKPHDQLQQQQQQQQLFPSSFDTTTPSKPFLTGLESFPISPNLLSTTVATTSISTTTHVQSPMYQYQMKDNGSSLLLMFGSGEQSCSSSDGSGTQIGYDGEQMGIGSYIYGGIEETQKPLLCGGQMDRGNEFWEEAPLDYGCEEIKQLISPNSGCNNILYFNDPGSATATRDSYKKQGRVMYY